jgi:hypothetical protein
MKWKMLIVLVAVFSMALFLILFVLGFGLVQKPSVSFSVKGKFSGVARQPWFEPLSNRRAEIYVGNEKIFSLLEDFWDGPIFIYPFEDGKRFLCDYDDDVAMLDFIVDFSGMPTSALNSSPWPTDDRLRADLARMATNIVYDTRGVVRLPNHTELQEITAYLTSTTPKPNNAGYFNFLNFWTKESLLLDLASNRQSCWP